MVFRFPNGRQTRGHSPRSSAKVLPVFRASTALPSAGPGCRQFDLTGGAFAALQSKPERFFQPLGEARVHLDELLAAPKSVPLIPWFVPGVEIESHGRAA